MRRKKQSTRIEVSADSSGDDPGKRVVVNLISSGDDSGAMTPTSTPVTTLTTTPVTILKTTRQVLKPSRMICPCSHLH
jgi:hypothetical protein